jgi:hypothetical protein
MATEDLMRWFHGEFSSPTAKAVQGTPFSPELILSIAVKEVGYLIARMLPDQLTTDQILLRCVGDTIERKAEKFPSDRADLEEEPDGPEMFQVAREALQLVSEYSGTYKSVFDKQPDAFCRGFGIFQYDLQFYLEDPAFFLDRRWQVFDECLSRLIQELFDAMGRNRWRERKSLDFAEQVGLAIAYNAGRYRPERGLKQGHRNRKTGLFYGEEFHRLLQSAESLRLAW